LVTAIGEDAPKRRKRGSGPVVENQSRAVTILDVGGVNRGVQ
jgi:hypothetical protein